MELIKDKKETNRWVSRVKVPIKSHHCETFVIYTAFIRSEYVVSTYFLSSLCNVSSPQNTCRLCPFVLTHIVRSCGGGVLFR